MSEDLDVLARAREWLDAGHRVALATVVSTWGSAPRPAGSLLAVRDDDAFEGSVSGGCVEGEVIRAARAVLDDGTPRPLAFGVTDAEAQAVGLACGGTIHVLVQRLEGPALLAELLGRVAARTPAVLRLDLGRGGLALVDPRAPAAGDPRAPGGAEPLADAARDAAAADAAVRMEGPGGPRLLVPFNPPVRVVVVGAVHIAQALLPLVRLAGWEAVLVDPRRAFATWGRFPGVHLERSWPDEALARLGLDGRTAVVTLTHDPKLDDPALTAALRSPAFYVGCLGSRRSQAARRERLRALGLGDAELARLRGPVGLDLRARSPAEIAVSIAAELVAVLRGAPLAAR